MGFKKWRKKRNANKKEYSQYQVLVDMLWERLDKCLEMLQRNRLIIVDTCCDNQRKQKNVSEKGLERSLLDRVEGISIINLTDAAV
jgi:hypothetical protein